MTSNGTHPEPALPPQPRRLGIVQTGGTIGAVKGARGIDVTAGEMILELLGNQAGHCEIVTRQPYNILSENARPDDWKAAAQAVAELVREENVDGVVVTHGTDTMTYTAAALSFMLRRLPVPVVLTGSMLSAEDPDTDGRSNLFWSVRAALHERAPREVAVLAAGGATATTAYYAGANTFHDLYGSDRLEAVLIRGTRARKVSAWPDYYKPPHQRYASFQSVHADLLGGVSAGGQDVVFNSRLPKLSEASQPLDRAMFSADTDLDTRVVAMRIYPGIDPQMLVDLVAKQDYAGVILEGYGDGNIPSGDEYSLLPAIEEITQLGACICLTSSVMGPATATLYAGTSDASSVGAVPLLDTYTECAIVKLMWVLAHAGNQAEVRAMMGTSLAGEMASGRVSSQDAWRSAPIRP